MSPDMPVCIVDDDDADDKTEKACDERMRKEKQTSDYYECD
jgi:hypothetical protein